MTTLLRWSCAKLEHFVAIAEEESFTRAARRLSYVQSALSVSIQALERELGVRLFDRTTHRVALTDVGAALLATATRTLAAVDELHDTAAAFRGVIRGTLRIGLMQAFMFVDVPGSALGSISMRITETSTFRSARRSVDRRRSSRTFARELPTSRSSRFPAISSDLAVTSLGEEELLLVGRLDRLPAPVKGRSS